MNAIAKNNFLLSAFEDNAVAKNNFLARIGF